MRFWLPRLVLILLLALALLGVVFLWLRPEGHAGGASTRPGEQTPPLGAGKEPGAGAEPDPPVQKPVRPLPPGPAAPYGFSPGGWVATFADTFDGDVLDAQNWSSGFGWGPYDGNAWAASCAVPSALSLAGGILTLSTSPARPTTPECLPGGKTYTSAAINTKGRFSQEFGYFEARLRMPGRRGVLGAWWLHRADGQWPPEIDIAEVLGSRPREHQMALHFDDPSQRGNESVGRRGEGPDLSQGFHVYGVDWQPEVVVFYRDGVEQARVRGAQGAAYQRGPSYLILNNMVCTSASRYWCESPDGATPWGEATAMEVDWVRVWRRE